jgi:hypothetical protein
MFDTGRAWVAGTLGPAMITAVTTASAVRRHQVRLAPGRASRRRRRCPDQASAAASSTTTRTTRSHPPANIGSNDRLMRASKQ